MKEVKKLGLRNNSFYLCIYESVRDLNQLPPYSKLGISKQSLNYYVRHLKIDGIIEKIGYGTWKIKKEVDTTTYIFKVQQVKKLGLKATTSKAKNFIRGHGFIISFKLPQIKNWDNRQAYLKRKDIDFKELKPSFKGCRIIIENHKIWLCKNSIVIYTPKDKSYFSTTAKAAHKYAIYDLKRILQQIEGIFKTSFRVGKYYEFKLARQHYANINNELAKQYNRNNEKLFIRQHGRVWLLADQSFTDELEMVDNSHAITDTDKVIMPFFNSLRANPGYTADFVLQSLGGLTENWLQYSENIKAHVTAIKKLGEQSEQQTKVLNQFAEVLKKSNKG